MKAKKTKTLAQIEHQGEQSRFKTHVVQGMTERLQQVFKKHDITLLSKPGYTLRQALVAPRDKLSSYERQEVIFSVKGEGCDGGYVG